MRVIFSEGGAGASSPTGSPSASSRFAPPPAAVSRLAPAVRAQVREAFEDVAGEAALIDRQLARVAVRILTRTAANRRGVPLREDELDAMMARASALVEVTTDRAANEALHARITRAAAAAVEAQM